MAVAVIEDVLGSAGWTIGGTTILGVTAAQNAVHWIVGVAVLGSFFAGDVAARLVARIIGIVFVVVTLLGVFARDVTGNLLDRQPAGVRPGRCPGPTTSCMPRRPCSR